MNLEIFLMQSIKKISFPSPITIIPIIPVYQDNINNEHDHQKQIHSIPLFSTIPVFIISKNTSHFNIPPPKKESEVPLNLHIINTCEFYSRSHINSSRSNKFHIEVTYIISPLGQVSSAFLTASL